MKRKLILVNIIIAGAILLLTTKVNAATATVTTETLNLREKADTSSNVLELLNADEKLEIISEEGSWYKVKHGNNTGYVSKDYVKVSGTVDSNTKNNDNTTTTTETNKDSNNTTQTSDFSNANVGDKITIKSNTKIRILPLINSQTLTELTSDTEAEVISITNNWIFVSLNTITGWIPKTSGISTVKSEETTNNEPTTETTTKQEEIKQETTTQTNTTSYSETKTKYINVNSAYVRSEASTSGSIVTTLIKDTDVKVTGESGDWYKVEYGSYSGYIYKDLLSDNKSGTTNRSGETLTRNIEENNDTESGNNNVETTSSKGEEIVAYANQYLGCSYVYGGSGPSTFDCSGFTMYVYKHFGYSLSHSATAQSYEGTAISKENLQVGDLVFFSDYQTLEGIGHCGIYIGNGEFIHASSGSGYCVKVSNLLSGSYNTRYVTARRLI